MRTTPESCRAEHTLLRTVFLTAALLISLACLLYGFVGKHVDFRYLWRPDGLHKLLCFVGCYWTAFLSIWIFRKNLVRPITLIAAVLTIVFVAGPWITASVAIFFLSSWALGTLLFQDREEHPGRMAETELLKVSTGFVILQMFMYATAREEFHYAAVTLALLLLPCLFTFHQLSPKIRRLFHWCRLGNESAWQVFAEALLCFFLFCSLLLALSPEIGTDALAMHLAVGTDIAAHHRFTFTPGIVSWSAMPLGADFCFALAFNLGGESAARLVNFGFLVLLLAALFLLGRRFTTRTADLLLALSTFVSCSLAQFAVDSLSVENLWAVLCTATLLAVLNYYESGHNRYLFFCSMLGGGAMMTKFGSLAFVASVLPFIAYAIFRNWNRAKRPKAAVLLGATALLLVLSAIPYAISYALTGNPVFPFLNAVWKSPFLNTSSNLVDFRWRAPIRSSILWDLTFRTSKYLESRPGGFGYTFLLFALPCCAVISRKWKFATITCVVVPLAFAGLTFHEIRYIRYLYPGLALASILIVYPLREAYRLNRKIYAALAVLGVAGTGLNYYFVPAFSGYEAAFFSLTPESREQYMQAYYRPAPAIKFLNRLGPHVSALFIDTVDIAGLMGHPYALTWHFYPITTAIKGARSFADIRGVLAAHSITYLIHSTVPAAQWKVRTAQDGRQYPWTDIYVPLLFQEFLQARTTPVFTAGGWEVRKLDPCKAPETECQSVGRP